MQAAVTAAYGLWLIASGLTRHFETASGNPNALWFGVVTGIMALVAALLWTRNLRLAARILVGIAIVFVLGFYGSKVASGDYALNLRIGATMLASVVEAVVICWPVRAKTAA